MVTREWGSLLEEDLGIEPGSLVPHPPSGGARSTEFLRVIYELCTVV